MKGKKHTPEQIIKKLREADVMLTEHRIARNHSAFEYQGLEKFQSSFVFVGLGIDTRLA